MSMFVKTTVLTFLLVRSYLLTALAQRRIGFMLPLVECGFLSIYPIVSGT